VNYHFAKPGDSGIHPKTTYYKLVDGSDGNPYIVCSGFYIDSF
jgi:polar amino acid transport system substrate-binding protein